MPLENREIPVAAQATAPTPLAGKFRDSRGRYKILLDLNNAIVSQTTREGLFRSVAKEIRKIVAFDRCCINVYEPGSKSLRSFATADGVPVKSMDEATRPLDEGQVARAVITSRQSLVIPDLVKYTQWPSVQLLRDAGLTATIAFPLIARGDVVGSLHFSFRQPPPHLGELTEFLADLSGQVALAVDNMLAHTELVHRNVSLQQQKEYLLRHADTQYQPEKFFYCSSAMRKIMREVEIIADSDASVLITGETGTGKDHIARYIHYLSSRKNALFVKVSCPALAESLFESELFGHVKGAFTGAESKRVGRFEMANGGTVFLDEIGELRPQLQAKLLYVLQDRRFERVGDNSPIDVNFRVIAATNCDLKKAIANQTFRSDLLYRLNTVSLHIPALRERAEEIEPLVLRLTEAQAKSMNRMAPEFSADAMAAMTRHCWPGNVRELRNVVNRLIIVFSGKKLSKSDIEPLLEFGQADGQENTSLAWADAERAHLIKVLKKANGKIAGQHGAAALLKIPRSTLQYKLQKYSVNPRDYIR